MRAQRQPDRRALCPRCAPDCKTARGRASLVRAIWVQPDGVEVWYCHRCEASGVEGRLAGLQRPKSKRPAPAARDTSAIAAYLWRQGLPARGTAAETYIREGRGIEVCLPGTLRYLPASGRHAHALIAAFGLAEEIEPGRLRSPETVCGVHLISLCEDGLRAVRKISLGRVSGSPIVLAPPNDGLGLVLAEGIEDALSCHAATGLGAWAAGSASHLAKLGPVVPGYVECVSLCEDDDPAGRKACAKLSDDLLQRGIEVRVIRFGEAV